MIRKLLAGRMRPVHILLLVALALQLSVAGASGLDMTLLKKDTQIFEGIVSNILRQNFEFFEIDASPKASYIEGFGIVLDFRLKINRSSIRTPFGQRPGGTSKTVRQHIQTVRAEMVRVLGEYGASIKQLAPNDRLVIAAHMEDRNELDPVRAQSVIVFSVARSDVERFSQRQLGLGAFAQLVTITEY